ncbi:hypothetical protein [Rhizobium azibense]|nr:hypothetical protein [Rhizobium azibense]
MIVTKAKEEPRFEEPSNPPSAAMAGPLLGFDLATGRFQKVAAGDFR